MPLKVGGVSTDDSRMKRYPGLLLSVLSLAVSASLVPARAATAVVPLPQPRILLTGVADTTFTLSSFNVLGSTHTEPGGKRARMASGVKRIRLAVDHLDQNSVDVVGMQELQIDQHAEFMAIASDRFGIFPSTELTRRNVQNSIAWRLDQWSLVAAYSIKIPYFDGIEWDMPYVLLHNNQTGAQAWFANFHNPATSKSQPRSRKWRVEATRREIALANQLRRDTKTSVFITGDMNERETYYCRMAGESHMKAANGVKFKNGVCTPPPSPMPVNWIFGVKHGGLFSNYVRDASARVAKITDHYVVRADVTIPAAPVPPVPPAPAPVPVPVPVP